MGAGGVPGPPIPTCQKAMMGTCQIGMRSPAVSLLLVCGKCPKTTEHSGLSQATCIFISPSPSLPTVPSSCTSPCAVLPVFLSYLPPSFVHSHRPFHRQSLPDLQQTDSVSRSATYLFSVTSNRLSTLTFPFRSLDPASGLPTSCP